MITLADFPQFFALLNRGREPFAWQRRLIDHVVGSGRWPDEISAPTGAGKSSVVDVHIFANALYAIGAGPRVPRRLAVVVNRRALVDHHLLHAEAIAAALEAADEGLLATVAQALRSLTGDTAGPVHCVSLRGGVMPNREWIDDPRVCSVIAATPDMWGSRVLFSAYGTSHRARPREAGLLAMDAVVVLDEAHLTRQLHLTAQVVADLARTAAAAVGVPCLQVVGTSATPSQGHRTIQSSPGEGSLGWVSIGVEPGDLSGPHADGALVDRLTRPKSVSYHPTSLAQNKGKASAAYLAELADLALAVRADIPTDSPQARTVGVIVNHVDTAASLASQLRKQLAKRGEVGAVVCWVGRMRPMDLEAHQVRHPGLFQVAGDQGVAFLVATQTVEVGIDLDLAGLVTELAPGAALAQRAGRVNRLGSRARSEVLVVGPQPELIGIRRPYEAAELEAAFEWLTRVGAPDNPSGLAPIALVDELSPPPAILRRPILSTLSPADALRLAETSAAPFAEADLSFWLRDDLEGEAEGASVVVRAPLPEDDACALALIEATPPDSREMFPATVWDAQGVVDRILAGASAGPNRLFVVRGGTTRLLRPDPGLEFRVRAGDVVVVDQGHSLTLEGVIVLDPPKAAETVETSWGAPGTVVWSAADHRNEIVRLVDTLIDSGGSPESPGTRQELRVAANEAVGFTADIAFAPEPTWVDGVPAWVVFRSPKGLLGDTTLRQEWVGSAEPIPLDTHSEAVADRAAQMADGVGLPAALRDAVFRAGRLHDAGKADPRFQTERMRWDGRTPLAKSGGARAQEIRRRRGSGLLSRGWRHEQLSAAIAFDASDLGDERDLVIRLVGTSHGHGRPFFPHGVNVTPVGGSALTSDETVERLFANGSGWSDIVDGTHRRFGVWGCAYLEALLRAADCQVSREGS